MRRSDVSLGIVSLSAFIVFAASPTPHASSRAVPRPTPQARGRAASSPAPQVPSRVSTGVRETSWSPDGKRLAVTYYDAIWTMAPDGRAAKALFPNAVGWISARDPAWSPDGKSIAFAAETDGEFDLWIVSATGGAPRRLTTTPGDERWPSWTRDGRVVFSHRPPRGVWQLYAMAAHGAGATTKITPGDDAEWQAAVSPDGKSVAFLSDRDLEASDTSHVWVRGLEAPGAVDSPATDQARRVTNTPGAESHPTWAPDGTRIAYQAVRPGVGSAVWVADVPSARTATSAATPSTGRGGRGGRGGGAGNGASGPSTAATLLASRHGGVPTWSPDGDWLAIATFPIATAQYNGNPDRNDDDLPMTEGDASGFELWRVLAPRVVDQGATSPALPPPDAARWTSGFEQIWQTLKSTYYRTGPSAAAWDALRDKYRTQAAQATDLASFEKVVDAMIAEQPLIKPGAESRRAVVTSGNPLASAAGAQMIEAGGNVVDAGIAVAIALGVVEPDATSLGGDGQAILFLKGMTEPVVVEYKDMSPSHATADNLKLFTPSGGRTANDGPTVANIPGVAAGWDLLYQKYGSHKVAWADIVAPAIKLADEGFILDEALPTTIAAGRSQFAKYPESAKLFLPGGHVPRPGDRFANKDYAETLRILAREGARSVYTGTIAQRIVADMAANGGVIDAEDLAQYRAMERQPLVGHYRGNLVYSVPAPVSSGAQLVETLNILDNYTPRGGATYTTDPDYFHYAIEAWRVRDGGGRVADPERWPVDYGDHLEPAHALERFKLIDPHKVYAPPPGGRGGGPSSVSGAFEAEDEGGPIQTGTTSFVVADAQGNMIAFTQTLSTWGGNFYVSKGLGFLYNDHFRGGGGRGGGFGSLLPLMRSNTTSVPTLLFAPVTNGAASSGIPGYTALMAVGCAGNAWIPASVYDIILNVVDGGMSAQRAIEAPRFLVGGGTGVEIEDRFPRSELSSLEAMGHTFQTVGRKGEVKYGYASVAVVRPDKGTVEAGAEPRRSHGAVGVK
jgi:gamma-glutamyltranspeptidase/glutathione hydrolase